MHLRQPLGLFVTNALENIENDIMETPIITYAGDSIIECRLFQVIAEGQTIGITKSLVDAVALFLITYFVFNFVYPSKADMHIDIHPKSATGS